MKKLKKKLKSYKRKLSKKSKSKPKKLPSAVRFLYNELDNKINKEEILNKYQDIATHVKVPKADTEMSVFMNWHQKDVTNINSNLQAQELYTSEKQFPGLALDVHLRLKYQAG